MSVYLSMEAEAGLVLCASEAGLLFPDPSNEKQALLDCVGDFPVIQHIVRCHDRTTFSLKARYKFYKAKPAISVSERADWCAPAHLTLAPAQLKRIMQGFNFTELGRALDAFHAAQDSSSLFYVALSDCPLYRALPATKYTDDASQHVQGMGDADALGRVCARLRVVLG